MAYRFGQKLLLVFVPPVAAGVIWLLGITLRYEDVAAPGVVPQGKLDGPSVYGFWHRTLLCSAYRFRGWGIAILISRSFDGELIARTVELLGFRAIRGSSSRGGAAGLRSMADAYREGHHCAITADGPRGPALIAKPGAAQLAELVSAPWVGAFNAQPDRAWVLNTWDGFLIPKPFSRVKVAWPRRAVPEPGDVQRALNESVTMLEKN